jgi:hypothetical protein
MLVTFSKITRKEKTITNDQYICDRSCYIVLNRRSLRKIDRDSLKQNMNHNLTKLFAPNSLDLEIF